MLQSIYEDDVAEGKIIRMPRRMRRTRINEQQPQRNEDIININNNGNCIDTLHTLIP